MFKNKTTRLSIVAALLFSSLMATAQTNETPLVNGHGTGLIPLTQEQIAKQPKVNWDILAKYSPIKNSVLQRTTGTNGMLLPTPPIMDQGQQGSCVGFAYATSMSIMLDEAMGNVTWTNDIVRSPAYIYNQIKATSNCASGSSPVSAATLVTNSGVCSWNAMVYNSLDCATMPDATQNSLAAQCKGGTSGGNAWLMASSVSDYKNALNLGYPIAGCINASTFVVNSQGVVTSYTSSGANHCVCVVGYDDSAQLLKVQNSWGTAWGASGFFYVPYTVVAGNFFCGGANVIYGVSYGSPTPTPTPTPTPSPTPVAATANFYTNCSFGGTSVTLTAGNYNSSDLIAAGIGTNTISSLKVAGYKVTLYAKSNFTGSSKSYTTDNSCLTVDKFDNKTMSLKIAAIASALSSVNEINEGFDVLVSPNPASDKLQVHIDGSNEAAHIQLMNLQGQILIDRTETVNGAADVTIDRGALPAGMYILQIMQGSNRDQQKVVFN